MDNSKDSKTEQVGNKSVTSVNAPYSPEMVDEMFADTLSRGMQNAITSQQNAQMTSATPITNACAKILQVKGASESAAKKGGQSS